MVAWRNDAVVDQFVVARNPVVAEQTAAAAAAVVEHCTHRQARKQCASFADVVAVAVVAKRLQYAREAVNAFVHRQRTVAGTAYGHAAV